MASDNEPRKFFRGPPLAGPIFLQILYNANDGFFIMAESIKAVHVSRNLYSRNQFLTLQA